MRRQFQFVYLACTVWMSRSNSARARQLLNLVYNLIDIMTKAEDVRILGVDAGGSGIRARVTDGYGWEFGSAETAAVGNPNKTGLDCAIGQIALTVGDARQAAGMGDRPFDVAVYGIAGLDVERDEPSMTSVFGREAGIVKVGNDLLLGLSMFEGPGAVMIAGSGSNLIFRNHKGELVGVGGHGPDYDEGGGTWLARETLDSLLRIMDGRYGERGSNGPEHWRRNPFAARVAKNIEGAITQLDERKLQTVNLAEGPYRIGSAADLHGLIYQEPHVKDIFGPSLHRLLVPDLFDAAERTLPLPEAVAIVSKGAVALGEHVEAALGDEIADNYVAGGISIHGLGKVIVNRPAYGRQIADYLKGRGISCNTVIPVADPLQGAVAIGQRILGLVR